MGLVFKDEPEPRANPKNVRIRAALFAAPFALLGIVALVGFVHDGLIVGGLDRKRTFQLLGMIAASIGFVALIFGINGKRMALKARFDQSHADTPSWRSRKEWANGLIRSTSRKPIWLLWILVCFWCFGSVAMSLAVVPWQWHQGNRAVLVALVFPVIGLALVFFACRTTAAWRRFGRTLFEMTATPAAPGAALAGQIRIPGRAHPLDAWHISLSCIRRTTAAPASHPPASERVLWRQEQWMRPDLPQPDEGQTIVPVFFKLPDDAPNSTTGARDGTRWRLEARASLSGPNFHAKFEVPVFRLPDKPEIPANLAVEFQLSLDDVWKRLHSKIRIGNLAGGKEFVFPSCRAPGVAAGASVLCLIWTATVALLAIHRAPILLPVIFGAMDLFMLLFAFDLWFRRSRATVSAGAITVETVWPGYRKEVCVRKGQVADIVVELGAMVGHAAYYDLKLRDTDGKELPLARNLRHKPEADWLARELTTALAKTSGAEKPA